MTIRAVIFDMDGTLTRSYLDFDAIRSEMGIRPDAGSILEVMEGMTPEQRWQADEVLVRHEQQAIAASELNEGAADLVTHLRGRHIHLGILTRNTRANALAVLEKHELVFDGIVGRDEAPVKPDAAGVFMLCQQFHVQPQESLMVGDYIFDVQSGKAAGATTVLLDVDGRGREFSKHADFTVARLGELVGIVDRS